MLIILQRSILSCRKVILLDIPVSLYQQYGRLTCYRVLTLRVTGWVLIALFQDDGIDWVWCWNLNHSCIRSQVLKSFLNLIAPQLTPVSTQEFHDFLAYISFVQVVVWNFKTFDGDVKFVRSFTCFIADILRALIILAVRATIGVNRLFGRCNLLVRS